MRVSKSMEEIWQVKEKVGRELEGKTGEEILAYFRDREPEWAKALPMLERTGTLDRHGGSPSSRESPATGASQGSPQD
jgi:hypothetical protein